ncbi:serine hydrolase domain-containing protein [Paenibacillus eucommiae]|uniref:CubicO group peptidase (Beta-lactamase class C family) n=1 Tax=Paenibacillus eucommiae TaxID=1355755 RepID=A0ABS4J2R5_9BACL|nr:serine hydrolase [Paenibacillus eucommiae]MBP1994132.1 CubicO group peptidase (beta-lactamase class C family) [Paenibacillus eucommiae]
MTNLFTPVSFPENAGIPSSAVLRFLERIDREQTCMHGFLVLRGGQMAAEGYWAPFTADRKHRMYSVSKSVVSLAVGLLIDEGKLHLEDRATTFFKDKLPEQIHPYLAQTTIRDLLMMSTPHSSNSYTRYDPDWAATFFQKEPSHPPGTIFAYDTAATVVLNTVVERISGVPFLEYMRPRLLDPIGFSQDAWCIQTPEGTSWGGSGVICTLRDMAKLANVCLNGGRWDGQQLISETYIREATSKQIDNSINDNRGYGYQIWMERDGGFSFRGMGSQFAFCYPEKDFIFACIADTQGGGPTGTGIVDAFHEELYPYIANASLPEDPETSRRLQEKIRHLRVLPQRGAVDSSYAKEISGKWYRMNDNQMGISRMRLVFEGDEGIWEYVNATGEHRLRFGIGKLAEEAFPETHYFGERIGTPVGRGYQCLTSAAWVEEHKLNLLVYITDDYFGTMKATFTFKGGDISVFMTKVAEFFLDEYEGFAGGTAEITETIV